MSAFTDARDNIVTVIKARWAGMSDTAHALLIGVATGFVFGAAFVGMVFC